MTIKKAQQIIQQATAALIPYARNSRTHSDQQVSQIAASIREFGFTSPVLVDDDNGIVAGHGRVMAAQQIGLTEVPTINVGWLTEAQRRAYVIADNQISLNAGWDMSILVREVEDLNLEDFDLNLLGFDTANLDALLNTGKPDDKVKQTSTKEINTDDYKMQHRCPRCQFEYNDEKA